VKPAREPRAARSAPTARLPSRGRARLAQAAAATRRTLVKTDELAGLRARLAESEETLRAIRSGEVDAVMGTGRQRSQVFSLEGAEHAYRVLIESMSEGALTLTPVKMILYANQAFARMVKCPLEQVTGSSFRRFLSAEDRATLRPLLKRAAKNGDQLQVLLHAADGSLLPVQISIRPLAKNGAKHAPFGMVVTDLTESRRIEELLRALTNRVLQGQEAERGRVALELHDHITQLLCAILFRCEALVTELATRGGPSLKEARQLRDMLGSTAKEVERISRNLRPGVLDQLGLDAVLRATCTEFTERTGVPVKLDCVELAGRLPPDTELALYRILQEALKNVEQHSRARQVAVHLTKPTGFVHLTIKDDGIGFDGAHHAARRNGRAVLGLLGMRERAAFVGGVLTVKSARGVGTEIAASILLPPATA
jgi:two-component system NarL family sensor kinase